MIADINIENKYNSYPPEYQTPLLRIRQLIYEVASKIPAVGEIEESLKWGQPSYKSKLGTPIRLDRFDDGKVAVFVHCQTTLIEEFKSLFRETLEFSKNRAIIIDIHKELPISELALFIEKALLYHDKK